MSRPDMDPREAMSCRQFVEIVTDYLEQQLDEARRLWTEEHLAECGACRTYLDQMRQTISALRGLGDATLGPAQRDRILAAMRTSPPASH
jgi:anti-sigma factor RsiW